MLRVGTFIGRGLQRRPWAFRRVSPPSALLAPIVVLLCSCPRSEGAQAPQVAVSAVPPAPSAPAENPPAALSTPPALDRSPGTPTLSGRIEFDLPTGARLEESSEDRSQVYISGPCPGTDEWSRRACVSVALTAMSGPAPQSLAEAKALWNAAVDSYGRGVVSIGEGVGPNNIFYAIRTFEVRVGFRGMRGQTIHRYEPVSRVFSVLSLDSNSHVACQGYVEHAARSENDRDIQAVLGVCLSLRRRSPLPKTSQGEQR